MSPEKIRNDGFIGFAFRHGKDESFELILRRVKVHSVEFKKDKRRGRSGPLVAVQKRMIGNNMK